MTRALFCLLIMATAFPSMTTVAVPEQSPKKTSRVCCCSPMSAEQLYEVMLGDVPSGSHEQHQKSISHSSQHYEQVPTQMSNAADSAPCENTEAAPCCCSPCSWVSTAVGKVVKAFQCCRPPASQVDDTIFE